MNDLVKALRRSVAEAEILHASYPAKTRQQVLNDALFFAVRQDETPEMWKWLAVHGADVNAPQANGESALEEVIYWAGSKSIAGVQLLLELGLDRKRFPDALLMCVESRQMYSEQVARDSPERQRLAEFLVQQGFPLDYQNEQGNTALHEAVSRYAGSYNFAGDLVPILLRYGANVHLRNRAGETPLDIIRTKPDPKTIALLEAADGMQRNNDG